MEVTSGGQVSHQAEDNDDESSMSSGLFICFSAISEFVRLLSIYVSSLYTRGWVVVN